MGEHFIKDVKNTRDFSHEIFKMTNNTSLAFACLTIVRMWIVCLTSLSNRDIARL